MRRLLLDTHVLLWWLSDDPRLSATCRDLIGDADNEIYVSAASTWEISIKRALGKLEAPLGLSSVIWNSGFAELPISLFHGEQAGGLPEHHKDPFDRMLIAQAQAEGLEIVSADEKFQAYGVRLVEAGE